ncbi:MAG TPA: ribonucleotide reductase subunit alpha [Arenimonas sp.]|nr:ribonucleotide reductase subunit alpha [Arenimonas sp.]
MELKTFNDLLAAATQQSEPQRLLFVFAKAELPGDATELEKQRFERGEGGALAPVVCVDKCPEEIESFSALIEESAQTGQSWDILFVSAMNGRGGHAPNPDEAVQPLKMMVETIKSGRISQFLTVDRDGQLVQLTRE